MHLQVCWGNGQGLRRDDVPVAELLGRLYEVRVGAFSIPFTAPAVAWANIRSLALGAEPASARLF